MKLATIALWAWSQALAAPTPAPARPPPDASHPAPAGVDATSIPVDEAPAPISVVVIVDDSVAGAEQASVIDAHLHGEAAVSFVHETREPTHPSERLRIAADHLEATSADAALWVTRRPGDVTEVYLVRAGREAMWMRPLPTEPGASGDEAVGIVVRSAVAALAEGAATGMAEVSVQPPPEPAPATTAVPPPEPTPVVPPSAVSPERTRGRALASVAYSGSSYADAPRWFSGAVLSAGWAWPVGVRVEAGYTLLPELRVQLPDGDLQLRRHPIHAEAGYDRRWGNVRVGGGLGVVLDWTVRRASADVAGAVAERDRGRPAFALAALGRIGVIAVWRLEVFTSLGLQAWVVQPRYGVVSPGEAPRVALRPDRLRAIVSAGLALRI